MVSVDMISAAISGVNLCVEMKTDLIVDFKHTKAHSLLRRLTSKRRIVQERQYVDVISAHGNLEALFTWLLLL